MKNASYKKFIKHKGFILPIKGGEFGWNPKIIRGFLKQLDTMLSSFDSVIAIRFDVNIAEYTLNNSVISELSQMIVRDLQRSFERLGIGYIWVREEAGIKQHYHWILLVDGRRVQPSRLSEMLIRLFSRNPFYHLHIPENSYYIVKKLGGSKYRAVVERASYLAKLNTKEGNPEGVHDYGTSRFRLR